MVIMDNSGEILFVNKKFSEIFQSNQQDLIGKNATRLFDEYVVNISDTSLITDSLETNKTWLGELCIMREGKEDYWGSTVISPVFNQDNIISHYIGVIEDISEKKKLEQEVIKSQKLESLGVLAGGIAHDFNNHLSAIKGSIEVIKALLATAPRNNEAIDVDELENLTNYIDTASNRSIGLTKQLLTFAKGGLPVKQVVNVVKIMQDTIDLFLSGSKILPILEFEREEIFIEADPAMISQTFSNLIINALEAMKSVKNPKFKVSISTRSRNASSRYVELVFDDNGPGISENIIDKIFDPYFSTKTDGSGLGLAVVFSIISKHEGTIRVESTEEHGSCFVVELPEFIQVIPKAKQEASMAAQPNNLNVLVMDDDGAICEIVEKMLTMLGHRVIVTNDGNQTIEIVKKLGERNELIDLALLDLTIRGGLGGNETNREIKDLYPSLSSIVMSGYSNDPVLSNYTDFGFDGILSKPFTLEELKDEIYRIFC
jgi:PAS domain S-box-containing protein